ncbi:GerAB/ArcD/ProY family transporter [Paenibacillus pasadenensis]|uniref:GerAB/ArcD/ProY family transporter n=1 Tax=Paenibacillus pasadenensis TaxID=217090 RepID=UPI00203DA3CE|nr:GerAB/ArcD/ProY family transporter [Paenibacillus pasadenensis]MCM3749182.1 GerAB/ArcD/ProY family transporter [Paenibacillus pasadenensis]
MKQESLSTYDIFCIHALYAGACAGLIYPSMLINSTIGPLWIPIAVWATASLLSGMLYGRLLLKLNGQEIVPFVGKLIGKPFAFLLLLPVLVFMCAAITVILRSFTELVSMTLLPTTPMPFMNGMIILPAALAASGFMPIARASRALLLTAIGTILVLIIVSFPSTEWDLAGPWRGPTGDFFTHRDFYAGSFVWMGFIFTAIIAPYSNQQAKRFQKGFWAGIAFTLALVLCFIYIPTMTFGREMTEALSFPVVSKMDAIYEYWIIFENLTAIFLSATLLCILLVLALQLKAVERIVTGIWTKLPGVWVVAATMLLVFFIALFIPEWRNMERFIINSVFLRLYSMFLFPSIVMLCYFIKQRKAGSV